MTQSSTGRIEPTLEAARANVDERPLGRILVDMGKLRPKDVDRIFIAHREKGLRFGEAARELRLVKDADIQQALSIQFNYPYLRTGQSALGREIFAARDPFDQQSEALRDLRTQLLLHWISEEHKVLAVVSPDTGDGRSVLAANLAVAFAQLGEHTLLIDADMRRPRQHRLFGHGNGPGLAQVLSGRSGIEAAERVSYFDSLWLLSAGAAPPNPLELLSRLTLPALLHEARKRFKIVLLDTPANSRGSDARITAARADGVLALVRQDRTRLADFEGLCRVMRGSGAQVAGTVLNRI
jgi:chain length determinant protein tyrosine kinase EpsG